MVNAFVSWPSAPLTNSLVHKALTSISTPSPLIFKERVERADDPLLQWCTYDDMDHELAHEQRNSVLSSSYTFRKALIRKHFLSRIIQSYLKKHPGSILRDAVPRTFEIEISFADELDEMWTDELWELGDELELKCSWWILKPGMADRGMGIRIFHTKDELVRIFEEFDGEGSGDDESTEHGGTAVVTSQLRHFVIQEYLTDPLLLDPTQVLDKTRKVDTLSGHKFHLRVYCVSKGDIQLYLYTRILALFSPVPYRHLSSSTGPSEIDLRSHLTNTSLQSECGEANVRLLDELEGCHFLSGGEDQQLCAADIDDLVSQIRNVLTDTFNSALQHPIHFQPLPNAFELFGVDFLVSHIPSTGLQVKLLEVNAEPAVELTGPRLTWILEDLFISMAKVCVEPFFTDRMDLGIEGWEIGEERHNLIKCMDENVRA
ncbi:hypothetical protein M413DRAFT_439754 [Hebeloma cylindrosporum]|uniref:Tubulin-tyrosine ligase n=1 Tax=Hebeloma cylindrosporum TaxID=76867 RepID=A0A0C3CH35_HEBCY|nr:hypothetical protein M413DRAFT_439754 [Hebeloma cylindrosporum h7]